MKGCGLRLHRMGECGAHPEPPLLLTLRRALESVSETRSHRQGQKESSPNGGEPQHSRRGRPCGSGGGDHLEVRGRFPPMWTHRENHGHRKIKGGKHVDYFVEEQLVTEKR